MIEPAALLEDFETVVTAYEEDPSGVSIIKVLKEEWHLFSSFPQIDQSQLLDMIMGKGFRKQAYVVESSLGQQKVREWEDFRSELKHRYRFFPESGPNLDYLEDLLAYLEVKLLPGSYFRARIQANGKYSLDEMGMPPADTCGNGRANPSGIPYFYIASDEATALAEVRPHPGDVVSVGRFTLDKEEVVVDLRDPRGCISPFGKDEDTLHALRQDLVFLQKLSDDLARPYQPRMAHLEYLPTQFLCEYIRKAEYAGVVYRSAVGDGINYVMFSEHGFHCDAVASVAVSGVKVISAQ
ncbi:MAG: RES family NAD+ phosphorylase [Clostridia bacterium]